MGELHDLTMVAQAAALRRREISSTELVAHYLARIEAHDPQLGAFVTVTADAATAAARNADDQLASGEPAPRLLGVPVAIKDLHATRNVRTAFGSLAFTDFVPAHDDDVVAALRAAGTISLGKTATSELGCSLYCETALGPPTRNPWQPEWTAGGSSGGAAAAVAAGLVAAAHGSDGGGSIRIPASTCGVVGFKPSRGVVPTGPAGFGGFGLPTSGPLARTVADAAALLDAMADPVPGEPHLAPRPPSGGYLAAVGQPVRRRLRVGRWTTPVLAEASVDPACLAAVDAVAQILAAAGHEVVEVAPPVDPGAAPAFDAVWAALTLGAPVPPERESHLLPLTRWLRERGRQMSVVRLLESLATLQAAVRAGARRLAGIDLLLSPTLATPQAPVGWFAAAGTPERDFARQGRFSPFCATYNLTGQPAVSLPVTRAPNGAPVSVMLAAAPGADALLLRVAQFVEEAVPWRDRHPPPWRDTGSATVDHD